MTKSMKNKEAHLVRVSAFVPEFLEQVAQDPSSLEMLSQTCVALRSQCNDAYWWRKAALSHPQIPAFRLPRGNQQDKVSFRALALGYNAVLANTLPQFMTFNAPVRSVQAQAAHASLAQHVPEFSNALDGLRAELTSYRIRADFNAIAYHGIVVGFTMLLGAAGAEGGAFESKPLIVLYGTISMYILCRIFLFYKNFNWEHREAFDNAAKRTENMLAEIGANLVSASGLLAETQSSDAARPELE